MRVKSAAVPVEAHQHPSREISNAFMVKDHTVATRWGTCVEKEAKFES